MYRKIKNNKLGGRYAEVTVVQNAHILQVKSTLEQLSCFLPGST